MIRLILVVIIFVFFINGIIMDDSLLRDIVSVFPDQINSFYDFIVVFFGILGVTAVTTILTSLLFGGSLSVLLPPFFIFITFYFIKDYCFFTLSFITFVSFIIFFFISLKVAKKRMNYNINQNKYY